MYLGRLLLLFPGTLARELDWEVQQLGHELTPIWDPSTTGDGLSCCATDRPPIVILA